MQINPLNSMLVRPVFGTNKHSSTKNNINETHDLQNARMRYETVVFEKIKMQERLKNLEEIFGKVTNKNDNKGFGRIAGYGKEKDILMQMVGSPIALEKDGQHVDVPNGILIFGPKASGKSLIVESFAEQLDCHLVKLEYTLNPVEDLKNLREVAKKAQERFEETGIRTIVQIDGFDNFAQKDSKIEGPLKTLIEKLSKSFHCTIFATTTKPEYICSGVLTDSRFEIKLPIAPADKENTIAILQTYTKGIVSDDVNFNELADLIASNDKEKSYSNMKLKQLILNAIKIKKGDKITSADFMKAILKTPKDISKEALELFKKQIEYVKHV